MKTEMGYMPVPPVNGRRDSRNRARQLLKNSGLHGERKNDAVTMLSRDLRLGRVPMQRKVPIRRRVARAAVRILRYANPLYLARNAKARLRLRKYRKAMSL